MTPAPKKKAADTKKTKTSKSPASTQKTSKTAEKPKGAVSGKTKKPAVSAKPAKSAAPATSAATTQPTAKKEDTAAALKMKGIRIRLSAFDHTILDEAAMKIIDTAMRTGAVIHGPIPLPTHIRKFTVNRSTFVHKDARDQFEMRTHRRLIDLTESTFKTVDSLQNLSLPAGVEIDIKMG